MKWLFFPFIYTRSVCAVFSYINTNRSSLLKPLSSLNGIEKCIGSGNYWIHHPFSLPCANIKYIKKVINQFRLLKHFHIIYDSLFQAIYFRRFTFYKHPKHFFCSAVYMYVHIYGIKVTSYGYKNTSERKDATVHVKGQVRERISFWFQMNLRLERTLSYIIIRLYIKSFHLMFLFIYISVRWARHQYMVGWWIPFFFERDVYLCILYVKKNSFFLKWPVLSLVFKICVRFNCRKTFFIITASS